MIKYGLILNHGKLGFDEFFSCLFSAGNSAGVIMGISLAPKINTRTTYSIATHTHAIAATITWLLSGTFYSEKI